MKKLLSLLCALALALLSACAPRETSQQFFAMNTTMTVTLYGAKDAKLLTRAQQEVFRLEGLFSRTREGGDIARLNADGSADLDADTAALLGRCVELHALTEGALNIAVAPVIDAWGFGTLGSEDPQLRVPDRAELEALLPLTGLDGLTLGGGTASLDRPGMAVDLGAVAKGYAAGKLQALLEEAGVTSALLDLGGNVTVLGTSPKGQPWRVGIKDPRDPGSIYCVLALSDVTVSTSGGYERYFTENGVTYHHILDPGTGAPARSGLLAVTAVSADGTLADGLSTACFILGADASLKLWRDKGQALGFELVLVGEDGRVLITEGLESGLDFQGRERGYSCEIVRR